MKIEIDSAMTIPLFRKGGREFIRDWDARTVFTLCPTLVGLKLTDVKGDSQIVIDQILEKRHVGEIRYSDDSRFVFKAKPAETIGEKRGCYWSDCDGKAWRVIPLPISLTYGEYALGSINEDRETHKQYMRVYRFEEAAVYSSRIHFSEKNFAAALLGLFNWNKSQEG